MSEAQLDLPGMDGWRKAQAPAPLPRVACCQWCGDAFAYPATSGRPRLYCGDRCRRAAKAEGVATWRAIRRFEASTDRWDRVRQALAALRPDLRREIVAAPIVEAVEGRRRRCG